MSVSNPLLKQLKNHILVLTRPPGGDAPNYAIPAPQQNTPSANNETTGQSSTMSGSRAVFPCVSDSNKGLVSLCICLESILVNGVQGGTHSPFGYTKHTYWHWMKGLKEKCGAPFKNSVEAAEGYASSKGRGRLLLRHMLVHNCLHAPLSMLKTATLTSCYSKASILGDEILLEILLSLVRQIDVIQFNLDLSNKEFLGDSWEIPQVKIVSLNTCLDLGLHLGHVTGRCVVIAVEPGSAAHCTDSIHAGDILTRIGQTDINGYNKMRVTSLMKRQSGASSTVQLTLLQGVEADRHVFPPLRSLLRQLNVSVEELMERRFEDFAPLDQVTTTTAIPSEGETIYFVGAADIGGRGDIAYIDIGVTAVIEKMEQVEQRYKPVAVTFVTGEIGVKVMERSSDRVLLNHFYTEISACGRKETKPLYFAYIAGNTTCSLSAEFTCYVFKAPSVLQCSNLLLTLADGFHRTHWAV